MAVFIIVITFILMEGVAWFTHKYVMHGIGWRYHKDHHRPDHKDSFFEKNDVFFIFFATLAMSGVAFWQLLSATFFLWVAIGVTLYGVTYVIIHDLFIHQRIKIWRNTKNPYLRALRRAHKVHHKKLDRHEGECFGMLWVPLRFFKLESQQN